MEDRVEVSIEVPLDDDGFLRRQCSTCEQQFKWFAHNEGDSDTEHVEQYFCPLCGAGADVDEWSTPAQVEYAVNASGPTLDQHLQESIGEAFKAMKGTVGFKPDPNFSLDLPAPEPLTEPNDMVAVIAPCHPNEPVKVPGDSLSRVHCLICGQLFAV
jgi:hypothetical protein